jgi:hypothetical protein
MAVLADPDRAALWAEFMAQVSAERDGLPGVLKADLRAAINAIDDWVVANATAFNTAIPQPARGALTTGQKARLLSFVALRRYQTGV